MTDEKATAAEVAQAALNALAEEFLGEEMPHLDMVLKDPDSLLRLEEIATGAD